MIPKNMPQQKELNLSMSCNASCEEAYALIVLSSGVAFKALTSFLEIDDLSIFTTPTSISAALLFI
jgi:hypothetical protein